MSEADPRLTAKKPISMLNKPLKAEFKPLFKALSQGITHVAIGNWEELGNDTVEALSALGLKPDPGELAFLLVQRSMTRALFDLVGEINLQLVESEEASDAFDKELDSFMADKEFSLDSHFFDRPADLPLLEDIKWLLKQWLETYGLTSASAQALVARLPPYFVYALDQEWRRNAKAYGPLREALATPFAKASEREWAWTTYTALLQRRVNESIFEEPFSFQQIYVPLHAYYLEDKPQSRMDTEDTLARHPHRQRVVVSLDQELEHWLDRADSHDTIRVLSGGPGSGKSSFARILADRTAQEGKIRVLYIPLHLIDSTKDLVDEVGRFIRDEGVLIHNPLDPESPEPHLLIIFDGLDELASQGKAAAETARAFIREVEKTVEKRNLQSLRLRVLISGRELIVQENESEFRRSRQILVAPQLTVVSNERGDCSGVPGVNLPPGDV